MKNYLKSYRIHLKVLGPVFIGSGKELSKKEYLFYKNNQIAVIDIAKFYLELKKINKLNSFEAFMLDEHENLGVWIKKNQINNSIIDRCIKYTLDKGDIEETKRRNVMLEFVKDPYGNPYVPGSSLKGMFRTIFLADRLINHSKDYTIQRKQFKEKVFEKETNKKRYLSRNIQDIEAKTFRTLHRPDTRVDDAVNDIMAGFIVSDSEPLSVKDLTLAQKVDVHVKKGAKNLPSVRECLKPGTDIVFTTTIDTSICPYTKQDIIESINYFDDNYNKYFVEPFTAVEYIGDGSVFLGGGSGYASKTAVYPLYDGEDSEQTVRIVQQIMVNTTTFDKKTRRNLHKHEDDLRLYGISPHTIKCTYYHDQLLQMGLCQLDKIEELN